MTRGFDPKALDRHITGNYGEDQFNGYSEDDTICVACGSDLPEEPEEGTWAFQGVCGPVCELEYVITSLAKFPDDDINGLTRDGAMRALADLKKPAQDAKQRD
jgi:hypothetical protein